ncbi:MAG: DEAD/DEAH box helicase [Candidatus Iainarchaeum sp.]|jgi:ATP-dependent RNA helicase DeaD
MDFLEMGLNPKLVEGLNLMRITTPTPIQEKCIPQIKAGKDVVGQSLTGSGKTAAFGLPILEKIIPGGGLQALIIVPTRELCVQIRDNLEQYSKFLPINIISVYGGVGFFQQIEELKYGEIVVATPGRLLDHIGKRNINLKNIKFVVLDEADRMFEMGFEEDVDRILRQTPSSRQTIMFSATMPKAAQQLIKKYLKNPINIQDKLQVDKSLLKQIFYSVNKKDKFSLLVHLLKNKTSGPAIVFCGTKREVDKIAKQLRKQKIDCLPVHGDLTQGKRQFAVNSFKNSKIDVLVATDVAARGLDIKDVSHVYNYDVPRTPEEYTHRIGRTARAGKKGSAVTLLTEKDFNNFNRILKFGRMNIVQEKVPTFEKIEPQEHYSKKYSKDNYQKERNRKNNFNSSKHNKHNYNSNEEKWYKGYPTPQRNKIKNNSFNQIDSTIDQTPNPNHEHTPRTLKPLFETSHYHPNYKKNKTKEVVKTNAEDYFKANKNRLKNNKSKKQNKPAKNKSNKRK